MDRKIERHGEYIKNRKSWWYGGEVDGEKKESMVAYCLMSNHVHFQLETIETDPGKIMKLLNMKYAIFFNKKYRFVGQLMQGRFQAEVIEDDRYFLALNRYIHLNPVKASIALHPKDYQWSSYNVYMEGIEPSPVDTVKTLGYFNDPKISRFEQFTVGGLLADNTNEFSLPKTLELDDDTEEEITDTEPVKA